VTSASPAPAERFAILLRWLTQAVVTRNAFGLSLSLIWLIVDRLRTIKQRVARLAARIRDGRYAPRRGTPRHPRPGPRRADTLPRQFGWLVPLVPEALVYRALLESLLLDPEMAALLAAAPGAMRRPLRSLCRMLGLAPPAILAPPIPAPRQPAQVPPPPTPPPPPPQRRARPPAPPDAAACGPPLPA
jgi:hypothetical protein